MSGQDHPSIPAPIVDQGRYPDAVTPWSRPEWRSTAIAWARERLRVSGLVVEGDLRVRVRPWSIVVRIPLAAHPPAWFKASPPPALFEAGLVDALARWSPGASLDPVAVDRDRGWMLTHDGGEPLRDRAPDLSDWERMLVAYSRLQRELVSRVRDLLALSVPDARTDRIPSVYARTVDELFSGVDLERAAILAETAPRIVEAADELSSFGIPDSLDHADVHDGQVLVGGDRGLRVFDWGDASVAHPFASLRVPLTRASDVLGPDALPRLRDAYLEPWSDLASPPDLRAAVRLSWRLSVIARAGSWGRLFPGAYPDVAWGEEQLGWLLRFREPLPGGL